jgi:hypothetical protein
MSETRSSSPGSDPLATATRAKAGEYDVEGALRGRHARRVGVYDRPERPALGGSSIFGTVLVVLSLLLAIYFLFLR